MLDRARFFQRIKETLFHPITQDQVGGITANLDAWERWAPNSDLRFIAYSLGTEYHETARTMKPIAEYGRGRGRAYGVVAGPYHQIYYGRGGVQLTWLKNYELVERKLLDRGVLKLGESLVKTPDLALRPDVAAAIMVLGMLEGWFCGVKLSDYFVGSRSDWKDARKIINGTDKANIIAGYALQFMHALESPPPH